jgi:hypothetical protein
MSLLYTAIGVETVLRCRVEDGRLLVQLDASTIPVFPLVFGPTSASSSRRMAEHSR